MTREINTRSVDPSGPIERVAPVVPHDADPLPFGVTRALFVGRGGAVVVEDRYGNVVSLQSGDSQYHPIRALRVIASGTTATDIVALY